MNDIQKQRLETLATHLESGKLFHDGFDFSVFHFSHNTCGSAGCALGECPSLFSKDWHFTGSVPELSCYESMGAYESATVFFGISMDAARHLFSPNDQNTVLYGGKTLGPNASREEVAENIREFIKTKESTLKKIWMSIGEYIWKLLR
jgi:hypothetical protein